MLRSIMLMCLMCAPAVADQTGPFATFHSASAPFLNDPHDLTFGPDGNLYVADKLSNRVAVMDPDTLEVISTIGEGELFAARDVSFAPDGRLYVAATGLSAVVVYDLSSGSPQKESILGPFPRTEGVLAHSNGRIYVMASGTGELIALENNEVTAIASGMTGAHDVAEGPDGSVWVADNNRRRLVRFTPELEKISEIKGPRYGFAGPRYLDFDSDGILFVADQDAHRILKIEPLLGELLGVIGTGTPGEGANLFDDPEGVAVRGSEYFFSDSDNNRVVKYVVVMN